MEKYYNDQEYLNLVCDILENEKFKKINDCRHHGLTRFDHSIRVSYYSYKICKILRLNYQGTARAGLLHDFFINDDLSETKKKYSVYFHPFKSLENSKEYFFLSDMEENIIISHMFPVLPQKVPKYLESWIVSLVDKVIATYEFYYSYGRPYVYKLSNIYLFLLLLRK